MKSFSSALLINFVSLIVLGLPLDSAFSAEKSNAAAGINEIGFDVYRELQTDPGNLCISPASISFALAMTLAGAEGVTEAEMARVLHLADPEKQIHEQMAQILELCQNVDKKSGVKLEIANRLWGQQGFEFLPEFMDLTRTKYLAELSTIDFRRKPEDAQQKINTWVEEQTQNRIKNLIPSPDMLLNARLVLTNAIYFKGDWTTSFDRKRTIQNDIFMTVDGPVKTPMMRLNYRFAGAIVNDLKLIELPYGDGRFSMVVILPDSVNGFSTLEKRINSESLLTWLSAMKFRQIDISLPKFTATSQFSLSETLKALGMQAAFQPGNADFSGMTKEQELFISSIQHKTFIDVNETGTEAAAATGVVLQLLSSNYQPPEPMVFRADHPFMYLIRDTQTGAILFLGRVSDPTN